MVITLTGVVIGLAIIWGVLAAYLAWRDRLINDVLLGLAVLVELGLIVLAIVAIAKFRQIHSGSESATFLAYAISLPTLPIMATLLAIKEKTRWAMGVTIVAAFAVAVMTARVGQIWNLYA